MAEGSIDLTIVTPERSVVHEQVDELQIPGAEGYLGILPGHAPLFSELKVGEVGYRKGETWFFLSVAWGFVEVQPNQVRILAETAERAHEIDIDRANRAKAARRRTNFKRWRRYRLSPSPRVARTGADSYTGFPQSS